MKNIIVKGISICFLACIAVAGCKKAETGPKGETGTAGTNGTNGNANVKTRTFTNLTWTYNAPVYETTIAMAEITQDIVDNGAVIVAIETASGKYAAVPFTIYYSGYQALVDYEYYAGGLKIYIANSQLVQPNVPSSTLKFKITAIAGSPFIKKQPNNVSAQSISLFN